MRTEAEKLLYEAIRELDYVQTMAALVGLDEHQKPVIASSLGEDIVRRGMKLLKVKDLAQDHLA